VKTARAWAVENDAPPERLDIGQIDLEKHLEDWIDKDPTIMADDVLLIGRQVNTIYGTAIDLLGLDASGNLVVIELKRDHTLRDTVAQGLEYAEWCSRQDSDFIQDLASKRYGSEKAFRDTYTTKFQAPFPETLNEAQRVVIVAPEISERTEKLLAYLVTKFGVPINAVSFDVLQLDGRRIIVRHTAIDDVTISKPRSTTSPQKTRTLEEFRAAAADNGVADIFDQLLSMSDILPLQVRWWQSMALRGRSGDGRVLAGFSIYPTSETNPSKCDVVLYPKSVGPLYGASEDDTAAFLSSLESCGVGSRKDFGGGARISLLTIDHSRDFENRYRDFASRSLTSAAIRVSSQEDGG
jgi:hypothetical protein